MYLTVVLLLNTVATLAFTATPYSAMELAKPYASGRHSPVETRDTFTLDVDMVIKATRQIPFVELVRKNGLEYGVKTFEQETSRKDAKRYMPGCLR